MSFTMMHDGRALGKPLFRSPILKCFRISVSNLNNYYQSHGRTNGVNAFCSTSLLYGIAPIPAIRATVCSNRSTISRRLNR